MKSLTTVWHALRYRTRERAQKPAYAVSLASSLSDHTAPVFAMQMLAILPVPALLLSSLGEVLDINIAMTKLLAHPRECMLHRSLFDFLISSHHNACKELLQPTNNDSAQPRSIELAFVSATDSIVLIPVNRLFLETTPPVILMMGYPLQDTMPLLQEVLELSVTLEERNAELHQLNQELQQTQHQRDRVTNMLVHDIRGPLVATSASFVIIERGMSEMSIPPIVSEAINAGKRGLATVIDLTNDLLDLKKLAAGHKLTVDETFSLRALCNDLQESLHSLLEEKRATISLAGIADDVALHGDSRLIRRVIFNILTNAIRFTPPTGSIILSAQPHDDAFVLLMIDDQGPGIAPDEREHIFQPLVQGAGESRRGTGLGLAFCREVIDAHGGRIWVEESPAGGSRFCMTLPRRS